MHKGNGDLNTHLQSEKHRKAVRGAVDSTKMTNYFVTAGSKCEDEITAAEGTLAFHAVSIIIAFSMDCTSVLLKQIFHDSNVARSVVVAAQRRKKLLLTYSRNILLMLL